MKSESLAVEPSVSISKNFPGDFIVQPCVRTGSGETSEGRKVCPLNPNGSILSQTTPLDLPPGGEVQLAKVDSEGVGPRAPVSCPKTPQPMSLLLAHWCGLSPFHDVWPLTCLITWL